MPTEKELLYESIRERDNFECQRCGKNQEQELIDRTSIHFSDGRRLSVHHIDGNHNNDVPENMVTVCYRCHWIIEKQLRQAKRDQEDLEIMCAAAEGQRRAGI